MKIQYPQSVSSRPVACLRLSCVFLFLLSMGTFCQPAFAQATPAPGNLAITQDSPATAILSWDGSSLASNYYIYRSDNGGAYGLDATTGGGTDGQRNSFRVGVPINTTCVFKVVGQSGGGNFGPATYSSPFIIQLNPPALSSSPLPQPTGYVQLSWSSQQNATDYYVYESPNGPSGPFAQCYHTSIYGGPPTTAPVPIARNVPYYYYVVAANISYTTAPSNIVAVLPTPAPTPAENNADPTDGAPCPECSATSPSGASAGEPVNVATGVESYEPSPDIRVYNPSGPAVVFTRNYRSDRSVGNAASPGLSAGWGHSYDIFMQGPSTTGTWGALTLTEPTGAQEVLTPVLNGGSSPTGAFTTPAGSPYLVSGTPSGTAGQWTMLTLTWKDQTVWQLTPGGGGYVLSKITNRMGQSLALNWNTSRRLTTIADVTSGNTLLTLAYDGNGNLSSATDSYGRKIVYTFGASSGVILPCLLAVSQISPASASSPPARWTFGYTAFYNEPLLSSISVPNPAGTGTATCAINYDIGGTSPTLKALSLVDGNGNQRVYTYGTNSTLVQVEDSASNIVQSWTQKFDSNGRDTGMTDSAGHSTTIVYGDAANPNRPTSVTDRNGHQTQLTYDSFGNVLTVTSPRGTVTTNSYSYASFALGRLMSSHEGTKSATTFDYYEPSGLVHDIYTPLPGTSGSASTATTTNVYDSLGNLLSVTGPGNGTVGSITTTFDYTDDFGDASHGIPALTGQTSAVGQPLTVTDNLSKVTHLRYDAQGHLVTTYDALGNRTDYNYTESGQSVPLAGQVQSVTLPATGQTGSGRATTQYTYQYPGGPLSATTSYDESGNAIRKVADSYGPEGELLGVTGSTEPVAYVYDPLYRLKTLTDGGGHVTSYFYNSLGYLYQTVYPGAQAAPPAAPLTAGSFDTITYSSYDNDGNVLSRVDGNNATTTYAYTDPESRLTSITYPAGTIGAVCFTYDAYGRTTGMTDGTGSQTYAYDDGDDLLTKTVTWPGLSAKTLTYAFNADGSRQSMTADGHPFAYAYDGAGRMSSLANDGTNQVTYAYLDNGWLGTKTLGNTDVTTDTRDAQGRLLDLANKTAGGVTLSDFAVPGTGGYDGIGNKLAETATIPNCASYYSGTTQWQYDYGQSANPLLNRSQLTGENTTRYTGNKVYTYDQARATGPGNGTHIDPYDWGYNTDNQIAGSAYYAYDGNGNPLLYKNYALSYDPENRLTEYGLIQTDGYSGDGLRAWKSTGSGLTYFLYDGTTPVGEYDHTGTLTALNVFGADGLLSRYTPSGGRIFYSFDTRGTVAERLTNAGNSYQVDQYDAYGNRSERLLDYSDPFGFGGQAGYYTDLETGLMLCTNRYYDSVLGRFLTRDPLGYAGGINLYSYTQNNPVNEIDPDGFDPMHHSFPKYLGGADDQPLTDMENQASHDALHNEMRQFLRNQRNAAGKDMEGRSGNPGRNIRRNFTPEEIEDALGRFYRGPGSKFSNAARDFFRQCPKQSPEAIAASRAALAVRASQAAAEARAAALLVEAADALVLADEAAVVVGAVVK